MNAEYKPEAIFAGMLHFEQQAKIKIESGICSTTDVQQRVPSSFRYRELRQLVLKLLQSWTQMSVEDNSYIYVKYVYELINYFHDAADDHDIFVCIATEGTAEASLNYFYGLLQKLPREYMHNCEILVRLVFNTVQKLDTGERYEFIMTKLMVYLNFEKQYVVLDRLLMPPLCTQPEIRRVFTTPHFNKLLHKITKDVIRTKCKAGYEVLHKCFCLTSEGKMLISSEIVERILGLISNAIINTGNIDLKASGILLAKIMPIICLKNNATDETRSQVFLCLFHMSMDPAVFQYLSLSDMREINMAWQSAIIKNYVKLTPLLLSSCADIIAYQIQVCFRNLTCINLISETMVKFIICSTQSKTNLDERIKCLHGLLKDFLVLKENSMDDLFNMTQFIEAINGLTVPIANFVKTYRPIRQIKFTLLQAIVNFNVIITLVGIPPTFMFNIDGLHTVDVIIDNDTDMILENDNYCNGCLGHGYKMDIPANTTGKARRTENPDDLFLINFSSEIYIEEIVKYVNIAAAAESLALYIKRELITFKKLSGILMKKVIHLLSHNNKLGQLFKQLLIRRACIALDIHHCRSLPLLEHLPQYLHFEENASMVIFGELVQYFIQNEQMKPLALTIPYFETKLKSKSLPWQDILISADADELWIKCLILRNTLHRTCYASLNLVADNRIIKTALNLISDYVINLHCEKDYLAYQCCVYTIDFDKVITGVEYMKLLTEILIVCPYEMNEQHWDIMRIGLGHWILSVSKSIDYAIMHNNVQTYYFASHVFKLYAEFMRFFALEQNRSSSEVIRTIYGEWLKLFSSEINLTLFTIYFNIVKYDGTPNKFDDCWRMFLSIATTIMEHMDHSTLYTFAITSDTLSVNKVVHFLLNNLSSSVEKIRITSMYSIRELAPFLIADDVSKYAELGKCAIEEKMGWHFLMYFDTYIKDCERFVLKYNEEFKFNANNINQLADILPEYKAFAFLMLWDCIMYFVAATPVNLRTIYTTWLCENKYEQNFFQFLFRAMPVDVLKNFNNKLIKTDAFKPLTWSKFKAGNVSLGKYACHLYIKVLHNLPALIRKWWNLGSSRRKHFVDTLTKNYATPIVCNQDLKDLVATKPMNMQVIAHYSTRETLVVYNIEEARMEVIVAMAPNYPLGTVKVSCTRQIGGRIIARNLAMQLSLFLIHQNGTLKDGLMLWKHHLDNKFEGAGECYICFSVIHHDNCLFPKLSCKTCHKRFHGTCLFKWFTTSSKSTCPICRNLF